MLNVKPAVERLNIHPSSVVWATQQVGEHVRSSLNPCEGASKLFNQILGVTVRFDDNVFASVCAKHMIKQVIESQCEIDNEVLLINKAKEYADRFCRDPKNSYLYAVPENTYKPITTSTQLIKDIDVKVEVHSTGKIKKGGKQQMAIELYKKYVIDSSTPLSNKEFISLLMKELDMTKQGASTYCFNCRKLWV